MVRRTGLLDALGRVAARAVAGVVAGAAVAASLAGPAGAQSASSYPTKPIRTIVSIAAGSVTDVIMRAVAVELAPRLGQSLVIENNGGASGIIAGQSCAAAQPDGYTVCVIYHSTLSFNPLLFNHLPYDVDKDFDLITRLFFLIEGLAVSAQSGVSSVAELEAAMKAKPAAFNFGTLGRGSAPDLFLTWLNNHAGTNVPGVAFRGGGPIAQALASNDIQIGKMGVGNFLSLAEAGKLKLISVDTPKRIALLPDVPTQNEAGIGGYKFVGWWGLAAPHGTPQAAIDRLNAEFVKLFREPKFVAFLESQAVRAAPTTPKEFAEFVAEDRKTAAELIRTANTPREDYKPDPAK